jgi:dCTP deaminase (dUMP-forming)
MTVLSGNTIKKLNLVENYDEKAIQPCSMDVRLSNEFIVYDEEVLVPDEPLAFNKFKAERILLIPSGYKLKTSKSTLRAKYKIDKFVEGGLLGTTIEYVKVPTDCIAFVTGRSSIGRLFVEIHSTAALLDAGWEGQITLEICAKDRPVILQSGTRVGQVYFVKLDEETFAYNGKYQNQKGVVESKIYKDFEKIDVNKLKKLYLLDGKSIYECAEYFDCEVKDVLAIFSREGIDISKVEQGKSVNKVIYDIKD